MITEDFEIIEDNEEARKNFGYAYGAERLTISKEHIEALLNGKCLAFPENRGEYVGFITLKV